MRDRTARKKRQGINGHTLPSSPSSSSSLTRSPLSEGYTRKGQEEEEEQQEDTNVEIIITRDLKVSC